FVRPQVHLASLAHLHRRHPPPTLCRHVRTKRVHLVPRSCAGLALPLTFELLGEGVQIIVHVPVRTVHRNRHRSGDTISSLSLEPGLPPPAVVVPPAENLLPVTQDGNFPAARLQNQRPLVDEVFQLSNFLLCPSALLIAVAVSDFPERRKHVPGFLDGEFQRGQPVTSIRHVRTNVFQRYGKLFALHVLGPRSVLPHPRAVLVRPLLFRRVQPRIPPGAGRLVHDRFLRQGPSSFPAPVAL